MIVNHPFSCHQMGRIVMMKQPCMEDTLLYGLRNQFYTTLSTRCNLVKIFPPLHYGTTVRLVFFKVLFILPFLHHFVLILFLKLCD